MDPLEPAIFPRSAQGSAQGDMIRHVLPTSQTQRLIEKRLNPVAARCHGDVIQTPAYPAKASYGPAPYPTRTRTRPIIPCLKAATDSTLQIERST
ncbi:hypothetical protein CEP88_01895 [Roseobacter denitrificans]|nr:hypothetical protein CEP88_01895 [Roseobacter denitrificans]